MPVAPTGEPLRLINARCANVQMMTIALQLPAADALDALAAQLRKAAQRGFQAVSLPADHVRANASAVADAVRRAELRLAAVVDPRPVVTADVPDALAGAIESTRATCAAVRDSGGKLLIVPFAMTGSPLRFDERARTALEALRTLRFDAERFGVRIALRFDGTLDAWAAESVRDLMDQANSYWVGCELTLADAAALEPLDILAHRVAAVRLERPGDWQPTDVETLNAALHRADYAGPLIFSDADGTERMWRKFLTTCNR